MSLKHLAGKNVMAFGTGCPKKCGRLPCLKRSITLSILGSDRRIISFTGFSGSGKTTFIEQLIPEIRQRGFSVAVIKHDAHRFEIDHEGKDSYRFFHAGCDCVAISSEEKTAIVKRNEECPDIRELIQSLPGEYDVILVEGYRTSDLPKIGVSRKETGKGLSLPVSELCAVITDEEISGLPVFALDDYKAVAEFILEGEYL